MTWSFFTRTPRRAALALKRRSMSSRRSWLCSRTPLVEIKVLTWPCRSRQMLAACFQTQAYWTPLSFRKESLLSRSKWKTCSAKHLLLKLRWRRALLTCFTRTRRDAIFPKVWLKKFWRTNRSLMRRMFETQLAKMVLLKDPTKTSQWNRSQLNMAMLR